MIARAAKNAAGIGGGAWGSGGTIRITGGEITATGSGEGAGIGGGGGSRNGSAGSITITGGRITANGGNNGPGIGGAQKTSSGTLDLDWTADTFDSTEIRASSYALSAVSFVKPYVLKTDGTLAEWTSSTVNNMAGYTIIPGVDFTQDMTLKESRWFIPFTGTEHRVDIPLDFSWTARIDAARIMEIADLTGTSITRLTASFGDDTLPVSLPAETVFTLTVLSGSTAEYYYAVLSIGASKAELTNFASMHERGRLFTPAQTDELYLLSADFGGAAASDMTDIGINLTLDCSLSNGTVLSGKTVSKGDCFFSLHETLGIVTAAADSVTVAAVPHDDVRHTGKTVYLVGSFSNGVNLADTTAKYGDIPGQWISNDIVIFPLGTYGSINTGTKTLSLEGGNPGSYTAAWKLCTGSVTASDTDSWNIRGRLVSNEATSTLNKSQDPPGLRIAARDGNPVRQHKRVFRGSGSESIALTVTANRDYTVTVQKATAMGSFTDVSGVGGTGSKTADTTSVTVSIPAAAGSYRIVFSMNDGSVNDNVYYAFIIDPNAE